MLPLESQNIIGQQYLPLIKKALENFRLIYKLLDECGGSRTFGDCDYRYTINTSSLQMKIIECKDMAAGWDYAFFLKEEERSTASYCSKRLEFHARQFWPYIGSEEKSDELQRLLNGLNAVRKPWTLDKLNKFLGKEGLLLISSNHSFEYPYKEQYTLEDFIEGITLSPNDSPRPTHPVYWDLRDPGFLFSYKVNTFGSIENPEIFEDTSNLHYTTNEHIFEHLKYALEEFKER